MILRSPRAPVRCFMAPSAAASRASLVKTNSTRSSCKNFWYCRIMAFLGSVKIRIKASLSRLSNETATGRRPTNSGIKPYLIKSEGSTSCNNWLMVFISVLLWISAAKPIPDFSERSRITFSKPANAPPQINKIFLVFIWTIFCSGCFLPPCGGTFTEEPSSNFNNPCCTPSPDTSLVIEGLSLFLAILSISSIKTIPLSAAATS